MSFYFISDQNGAGVRTCKPDKVGIGGLTSSVLAYEYVIRGSILTEADGC